MTARTVTFAGFLRPGDWTPSDDGRQVIIHRKTRDWWGGVPGFPSAMWAPVTLSRRPYLLITVPMAPHLGASFEGICAQAVAETAPAMADQKQFLPGAPLEAWLLPVVQFMFEFLLTPEGK